MGTVGFLWMGAMGFGFASPARERPARHRRIRLDLVPSSNDRLGQVVLIAEDAYARGIQNETRAFVRWQAEPARREHP